MLFLAPFFQIPDVSSASELLACFPNQWSSQHSSSCNKYYYDIRKRISISHLPTSPLTPQPLERSLSSDACSSKHFTSLQPDLCASAKFASAIASDNMRIIIEKTPHFGRFLRVRYAAANPDTAWKEWLVQDFKIGPSPVTAGLGAHVPPNRMKSP